MEQQGKVTFTLNDDKYIVQYLRTDSTDGPDAEPDIEMVGATKGEDEKELDLEKLTDKEFVILEALTRDLVLEKEKGGGE